MTNETFKDIEKLESDLWEAADNLRANSKLISSDYFMPVLGIIFLRHAANRFEAAERGLIDLAEAIPSLRQTNFRGRSKTLDQLLEQHARHNRAKPKAMGYSSDAAALVIPQCHVR